MYCDLHISVIIPAHNESRAIGRVLQALAALETTPGCPLVDDLVVCDNASTDGTGDVARQLAEPRGWQVVQEPTPGYGAACHAGLSALGSRRSRDDVIVFVDGDCSVAVEEMSLLLDPIVAGADLVIGNRVPRLRASGALTPPQRFGNALATRLIGLFWGEAVSDLGPFRAIRSPSLSAIDMRDRRFGWTVEMQVRAIQEKLAVREVPVTVRTRVGRSKISGTVRGVTLAGYDILSTIFSLYIAERFATTDLNHTSEKLP